MNQAHTTHFSTRLRLLCGLALLIGLCIMMGGLARPAHAQSNLSVSDCSSDTQLQAAVAQANSDNAGDVITFACSGDLKLTSTLTIAGSMTLDGSGQSVTLDGGDSMQVLVVRSYPPYSYSGVSLTLKALTIAHGSNVPARRPSAGASWRTTRAATAAKTTLAASPMGATTCRAIAAAALAARAACRTPILSWVPWRAMAGRHRPWPCSRAARPSMPFRSAPTSAPPATSAAPPARMILPRRPATWGP